jgi:hypothetical protein
VTTDEHVLVDRLRDAFDHLEPPQGGPTLQAVAQGGQRIVRRRRAAQAGAAALLIGVAAVSLSATLAPDGAPSITPAGPAASSHAQQRSVEPHTRAQVSRTMQSAVRASGFTPPPSAEAIPIFARDPQQLVGWHLQWEDGTGSMPTVIDVSVYPQASPESIPCKARSIITRRCAEAVRGDVRVITAEVDGGRVLTVDGTPKGMWLPVAVAIHPDGRTVIARVELREYEASTGSGDVTPADYNGVASVSKLRHAALDSTLAQISTIDGPGLDDHARPSPSPTS